METDLYTTTMGAKEVKYVMVPNLWILWMPQSGIRRFHNQVFLSATTVV